MPPVVSGQCGFVVRSELPHATHHIIEQIRLVSIAILCVFASELSLLFCSLGVKFFRRPLYVVDAVIVALSLYADVVLHDLEGDVTMFLTVFVRLWRCVRILHGVGATVHEHADKQLELVKERCLRLEEENKRLKDASRERDSGSKKRR
jgi:hypothetical protein